MAPYGSCGCGFAGVHAGAGAAHMPQLGAVRHVYCKQWSRVRSWVAVSAGPVHGLRREHCHDGPLRRQLCGYWTVSSSGEIGTAHVLARGPGRCGLQWAMCLHCARGRVCELGDRWLRIGVVVAVCRRAHRRRCSPRRRRCSSGIHAATGGSSAPVLQTMAKDAVLVRRLGRASAWAPTGALPRWIAAEAAVWILDCATFR